MKNKTKKPKLLTISQYQVALSRLGINVSPQALHARKNRGALEFVIGGETPEYKIDTSKYPPEKFKIENRGRKKTVQP